MAGTAKFLIIVDFPDFWKINGWNVLTLWTPISCCAPGLLSYPYYFAYIPPIIFSRPIVNQGGGLFWILSDSNVYFDGQSSFFPGFVKYGSIVSKDW